MKINGIDTNYDAMYIYNPENGVIFKTVRPYDWEIELEGLAIRNARKINFAKGDCFTVATDEKDRFYGRNGKDLYIPDSILEVVSITEKQAATISGETNYKNVYELRVHCAAHQWIEHREIIENFPEKTPITEYDPRGVWGEGYRRNTNTYHIFTHWKTNETKVVKQWLTWDTITSATLESDYYTRSEKTADRIEREKIAAAINDALNGKRISHYDVEKLLEVVDIKVK